MSDDAVSISLSEEERLFIDCQLAAGKCADDAEMLHAGLAALELEQRLQTLRELIAEGDANFERGGFKEFGLHESLTEYIVSHAEELRGQLANAEASGQSDRSVPAIMNAVKTKLRANGAP
jgi:putative addiction module CopG family antidote